MKKIIIINLILLIFLYFAVDLFCFRKDVIWNGRNSYVFKDLKSCFKYYLNTYSRIFYTEKDYDKMFIDGKSGNIFFRSPENPDAKNNPLLLMGCSFTYGTGLNANETLGHKLAYTLDRPVYNRAISAHGVGELLYQLQSDKFYTIVPKPEWLIYIYMNDHLRRIKVPCSVVDNGVYYGIKNDNLFIKRNITTPLLYTIKLHKYQPYFSPNAMYLYGAIMKQAVKELDSHYDNDIKHLALMYERKSSVPNEIVKSLQEAGFYVYFVEDLTNVDILSEEYRVSDKLHPSEEAWDILLPSIIEKLDTLQ